MWTNRATSVSVQVQGQLKWDSKSQRPKKVSFILWTYLKSLIKIYYTEMLTLYNMNKHAHIILRTPQK